MKYQKIIIKLKRSSLIFLTIFGSILMGSAFSAALAKEAGACPDSFFENRVDHTICGVSSILINEVDADTAGTEVDEFIELYDGGAGNTPLDGLVIVLFNGSDGLSYTPAFDLDGYATDENGYFVIGGTGILEADLFRSGSSWLQNGADAVALYTADGDDFPNDSMIITSTALIDAIVYDTNDSDNPVLLNLLNEGQPQVNENALDNRESHASQRCENGAGGP